MLIGNWLIINSTINSYSGVGYYDYFSDFDCPISAMLYFFSSVMKQDHPPLFLDTEVVKDVESHTHLRLTLQSNMSWRNRIVKMYNNIHEKFTQF